MHACSVLLGQFWGGGGGGGPDPQEDGMEDNKVYSTNTIF